jgi:hypothetical protein
MVQVSFEESVNDPFEARENVSAVGVVANAVHHNVKIPHAICLMQHFDAGIGVDERGGLADDNDDDAVAGLHEFKNIVINASGKERMIAPRFSADRLVSSSKPLPPEISLTPSGPFTPTSRMLFLSATNSARVCEGWTPITICAFERATSASKRVTFLPAF